MKKIFSWSVLFTLLGASLSVWMWTFWSGISMPIDLISPTLWNYPVIDWLVSVTLIGFGILAFAYTIAEERTKKNLLYGLPVFALNAVVLFTWWLMEIGKGTDVNVAMFLFSFAILINARAAVLYLVRHTARPAIETE